MIANLRRLLNTKCSVIEARKLNGDIDIITVVNKSSLITPRDDQSFIFYRNADVADKATGQDEALDSIKGLIANYTDANITNRFYLDTEISKHLESLKEISEEPKETSEEPKETSEEPKETSEGPKETSEEPKETSEGPKETSEEPKETSRLDINDLLNLFGGQDEQEKLVQALKSRESKPIISVDTELEELKKEALQRISDIEKLKEKKGKTFSDNVEIQSIEGLKLTLKEIDLGCDKCNHTGIIIDPETGISMQCECLIERIQKLKEQLNRTHAPKYTLSNDESSRKLIEAIIPFHRRDDEYNSDITEQKILEIIKARNARTTNSVMYKNLLDKLLSDISLGLLDNSYIIGAPNGFSKTTFVYTCLKRLIAQGKKVVPYKSLAELAQIKLDYEKLVLEQFKYGTKSKKSSLEFTWRDYLEADVLFTYLSSVSSAELESAVLSSIMQIRGQNGKPTIVMTSTTLKIYTNNPDLNNYYWADMLDYTSNKTDKKRNVSMDRLIHYSCYIIPTLDLKAKQLRDY